MADKSGTKIKGKIGLEIHTYIITKEKLFCNCAASREKGVKPNINICPICTGQPGAKPMAPNLEALRKAVSIGLMLGCKINESLKWQRKHYDWPDLPKGYQNTISGAGAIPVGEKGKFSGISIWSMHLEEDPASWNPDSGCVDYNRSGLPLVEIITAPEFSSAEEVMEWLKKLIQSLDYLKAVDSDAGIKVDTNVNIPGKTERVEIKNINSIENIGRAIDYELKRQSVEGGKTKETRRFDELKGKTEKMREKESTEDYRFIREPDLKDIVLESKMIKELKDNLPESPEEKLGKLVKKYKIGKEDAKILAKNIDIVEFFEEVVKTNKVDGSYALPWVTVNLLRLLNDNRTTLDKIEIKVEHFAALLENVKKGKITELQGKEILKKFYPKSFTPSNVEGKIADEDELSKVALVVLKENAKAAEDYRKGEKNALNFLVGGIMQKTNKRADFAVARKVLEKILKK